MAIITEEMRFRQCLCEYALKDGGTKAAKMYHTNRQSLYRQLEKYDGSVRSLALKSRNPHCSSNTHTEDELALIKRMMKRNRSILKIVKEKSSYETGKFLQSLEKKMGFKVSIIQVDNGAEFVNDEERTDKLGLFQKIAESLGMQVRRTRPYSPWQNGKVKRSHREDGKILYKRKVFTSEAELKKQVQKHEDRYNRTAKTSLDLKSPNQVVEEYFSKCNICLDS